MMKNLTIERISWKLHVVKRNPVSKMHQIQSVRFKEVKVDGLETRKVICIFVSEKASTFADRKV